MRKILLTLFAMALLVAFTAPSYAADFKMTGFFRIRGMSGNNNNDRDDDKDDSASGLDALTRPRFTATTDKGTIWAMWEIDWWEASVKDIGETPSVTPTRAASANAVIGANGGGRVGVGTNRWVVDFAIPGSALRARWGRTDYTSPDNEIFDSNGTHRRPGIGVYGKLSKNISLSMFMTKISDGATKEIDINADGIIDEDEKKVPAAGTTFTATDDGTENYYAALGIKVSPTVTLTPWVAYSRNGDTGQARTYAALHAKTKVGIFGLEVTGVTVGGDHDATTEASGWGLLVRGASNLGKLTLRGKVTLFSGDDNADDNEEGNFGKLFPSGAGTLKGGLFIGDRTDNIGSNSMRARLPGGAKGTRSPTASILNGAVMVGGEVEYAVSKTLVLHGAVHVYQSAEEDDMGNNDYGTEFNTGFRWKIYPKLELRTGFAYLAAGDYGSKGEDLDDSWAALWSLRHAF